MGSVMSAIKCPCCAKSAFEDCYYKSGETYIHCRRCGYNYSRVLKWGKNESHFEIEEYQGYGVMNEVTRDGKYQMMFYNTPLSPEKINEEIQYLKMSQADPALSFLVTFENGVFTIHYGTPTINFHLSFEDYEKRMKERYPPDPEDRYPLVPMEE